MSPIKVFISFDYENDLDIKRNFIKQSERLTSTLKIVDVSINQPITEKWKEEARRKIQNSDYVIVLCGEHTHEAKGVAAEITIAQELNKKYILIKGRRSKAVNKPQNTKDSDQIISWKWKTIESIIMKL